MEESADQSRESEPPSIVADYKAYQDRVTSALVAVTKTTGGLAAQDLSFHRSSSDQVSRSLDRQNAHLLRLTNKLLKAATQETNINAPQPRNRDGVEDNWRGVVDVIDDLLEKADASLDEFTGAIKRLSPSVPDRMQTPPRPSPANSRPFPSASRSRQTEKPQLLFDRKVNNHDTEPFKPLLISKPHAIVPLEECIGDATSGYKHPYGPEIEKYQYPPEVYQHAEPIHYRPIDEDSAIFVDTEDAVHTMLAELKTAKEIAVDLEHHDYRTYGGIVSLMQISTRQKDWIVDTLKPWRENLQVLNEVFADPSILKVFHGSAMDMIWLQRDLGIYVVGLFDTYYACDALNFPGRGLKYLLLRYANVEAQKQYQMADWRQRPLSPELISYARSDTHYLLYIFDEVRNLLVKSSTPTDNLVHRVLEGSKKEALQTHKRFFYDFESGRGPGGWYGPYAEKSISFTAQQFAVFKALHQWRDQKAREWDESTTFIMPLRVLFEVADAMPKNMTTLYKHVRPVPEVFQSECAPEIFKLIAKTIDDSKDDPPVYEQLRQNEIKYGALPENRWKKKAATPKSTKNSDQSQLTGVAEFLQQAKRDGDLGGSGSVTLQTNGSVNEVQTVVRSHQSGFWGSMLSFMQIPYMDPAMALEALDAILPLPDISGDAFTIAEQSPAPEEGAAPSPLPNPMQKPPDHEDVFTLRDRSTLKRKADDALGDERDDDDNDPFADHSLSSITDAEASVSFKSQPDQGSSAINSERAQAKGKNQRKAEKRARRAAEREEQERKVRDMVPFDYDAAESVLEPRTPATATTTNGVDGSSDKGNKGNKGKNKHMNPFAKALDTGTGARRNKLGQEGAGRSMTFKS